MKRVILIVLIILSKSGHGSDAFLNTLSDLGKDLAPNIEEPYKLAVGEFVDLDGNISSLGKFIAEELITEIASTNNKNVTVIERRLLMKVLAEQELSISELVEPEAIKNVGKLLGAGAIVTGTITEIGEDVRINARAISTKTGEIVSVARATIPATGMVKKMVSAISNPSIVNNKQTANDSIKTVHTQSWSGLDIALRGCDRIGSTATCLVQFTATQSDLVLNIHQETAVFDNTGNKSVAESLQAGASDVVSVQGSGYIYKEMIKGVMVNTKLSFPIKDANASGLSSLRLVVSKSNRIRRRGDLSTLSFRNIRF